MLRFFGTTNISWSYASWSIIIYGLDRGTGGGVYAPSLYVCISDDKYFPARLCIYCRRIDTGSAIYTHFFSLLWHNERRMNNLSKLWHKKCKSLECVRAFFEQSFGVRLHSLCGCILWYAVWRRRRHPFSSYLSGYDEILYWAHINARTDVYMLCACVQLYTLPHDSPQKHDLLIHNE